MLCKYVYSFSVYFTIFFNYTFTLCTTTSKFHTEEVMCSTKVFLNYNHISNVKLAIAWIFHEFKSDKGLLICVK